MKVNCPYCSSEAKLIDSSEVYSKSYGFMWICWKCDARTGCHASSSTHKPLGTLAKPELRKLRQQAHDVFDPLWKNKTFSRNSAYKWLAGRMNITKEKCHISMMSEAQCKQVIELCKIPF